MAFDSSAIRPAIGNLPEIDDLEDRATALEGLITGLDTRPVSSTIDFIEVLTQAAYDAIVSPDSRTLYIVVG